MLLTQIVIFSWSRVVVPQPVLVSLALALLKRHQSDLCATMAGFPSHLRDGIVLCCTQDARIYPRKQKLGLVGASNISKEKKKQQKVRSSASSCSDGGEVGERPTGVDLEQEDRGARHQPLGQDAAQDRVGEEHAFRPYFLG